MVPPISVRTGSMHIPQCVMHIISVLMDISSQINSVPMISYSMEKFVINLKMSRVQSLNMMSPRIPASILLKIITRLKLENRMHCSNVTKDSWFVSIAPPMVNSLKIIVSLKMQINKISHAAWQQITLQMPRPNAMAKKLVLIMEQTKLQAIHVTVLLNILLSNIHVSKTRIFHFRK